MKRCPYPSPLLKETRSNVVTHQLLSGNFTEICPWLVRDLAQEGLWNEQMRLAILQGHGTSDEWTLRCGRHQGRLTRAPGSVQGIRAIPQHLRDVYRTAWEIEPFQVVDMAGDRAPFIEQSQSLSLSIAQPSTAVLVRGVTCVVAGACANETAGDSR